MDFSRVQLADDDQKFLDELEKRLYLADVGTTATATIVDRVRQGYRDKEGRSGS